MCVNILRVPNKKSSADSYLLVDRLYNYVPCGKCYECRQLQKNDYTVRALFHYRYYRDVLKGKTFFYTLTYNNDNLPTFKGHQCFSKRDVQLFLKRLRKKLSGLEFDYFITSEYGSRTFRPHYHALFFVKGIGKFKFKEYVRSSWNNGFICAKNGGEVYSDDAIYYCSKYVNKDYGFKQFISDKENYSDVIFDIKDYNKKENESLTFDNFHLQSIGFGLYLNNFINEQNLVDGNVKIVVSGVNQNVEESFSIPLYNKRKLMYYTSVNSFGNVVYRLNDYGISIFKKIIRKRFYLDLAKFLNVRENLDKLFPRCISSNFFSLDYARFLMFSVDPNDLISYKNFYRGVPFVSSFYHLGFKFLFHDVDTYYKFYRNPEYYKLISVSFYHENKDYDIIIDLFQNLCNVLKYDAYVKNVESYNTSQYLRSLVSGEIHQETLMNFREYSNYLFFNNQYLISNINYNKRLLAIKQKEYDNKILNDLTNILRLTCLKNYYKEELPFPSVILDDCPF